MSSQSSILDYFDRITPPKTAVAPPAPPLATQKPAEPKPSSPDIRTLLLSALTRPIPSSYTITTILKAWNEQLNLQEAYQPFRSPYPDPPRFLIHLLSRSCPVHDPWNRATTRRFDDSEEALYTALLDACDDADFHIILGTWRRRKGIFHYPRTGLLVKNALTELDYAGPDELLDYQVGRYMKAREEDLVDGGYWDGGLGRGREGDLCRETGFTGTEEFYRTCFIILPARHAFDYLRLARHPQENWGSMQWVYDFHQHKEGEDPIQDFYDAAAAIQRSWRYKDP